MTRSGEVGPVTDGDGPWAKFLQIGISRDFLCPNGLDAKAKNDI